MTRETYGNGPESTQRVSGHASPLAFVNSLKNLRNESSGGQIVTMMQAAKSWHGYDSAISGGIRLIFTIRRGSLIQRKVRPVVMVVTNILAHQSFQVSFVEHYHVVSKSRLQLPTQRSATPFCQGLFRLVRLGRMPKLFTVLTTP